jgi:arylsulfatase A-like enzyme
VLDAFDENDLWKDTALIVTTDHGFLLGEHDFWAKNRMNLYEEVAHIPLFFHHPDCKAPGTRRQALTQNIDLAATFLDMFGAQRPAEMQGFSLLPLLDGDRPLRTAALFGYFGGAINVTDGRYTYHRYPEDLARQDIYQYTLMPTHLSDFFKVEELQDALLSPALPFTKGARLLKIPINQRSPFYNNYGPGALIENETRLYDLETDPGQASGLSDPGVEQRMIDHMRRLMAENDAPPEAYARVGLSAS